MIYGRSKSSACHFVLKIRQSHTTHLEVAALLDFAITLLQKCKENAFPPFYAWEESCITRRALDQSSRYADLSLDEDTLIRNGPELRKCQQDQQADLVLYCSRSNG